MEKTPVDRRQFIESAFLFGMVGSVSSGPAFARAVAMEVDRMDELTIEVITSAEQLVGVSFSDQERELMLKDLADNLESYKALREVNLSNATIPSEVFDPLLGGDSIALLPERPKVQWEPQDEETPSVDEDLAFSGVSRLAGLLRARKIRSVDLTELCISRLKKYDGVLQAVVTLTEDRAYRLARQADSELDAGYWRGPLHGIPWGAKDLLAVSGYPTTWGAAPFRDQAFDTDATVVRRLDDAGAVLVAKLSLGALAWGDVWFGGKTKCPWNLDRGSSGSSAGPGAAVSAGLVPFAIGSETLGSIVSPSNRNGVTGLRPTFGRVSRAGAMTLSWTMDKLGPMCRSAEDCALVFSAIHGADLSDPTARTTAFDWPITRSLSDLRIGYLQEAFEAEYSGREADAASLDVLRSVGADLISISLPDLPAGPLLIMLNAEAAAAFQHLTLSGGTTEMVRQERNAWPNVFRHSHFIPAVEYINASRVRTRLMQSMHHVMEEIDVFVSPTFGGGSLQITNLTGHPSVTIPNGFTRTEEKPESPRRNPKSITIVGSLFGEDRLLRVAAAFQAETDFHLRRPPIA